MVLFSLNFVSAKFCENETHAKRSSFKVWEINMEVCPHLELDDITLINCLGMTFIFMVHLICFCNSIVNL